MSADYFSTVGLALKRGRGFGREDVAGQLPVAVVNEAFVRRHFPGEDPLGHVIGVFGVHRRLVGVSADERFLGVDAEPAPAIYLPIRQSPMANLRLMLRTRGVDIQAPLPRGLGPTRQPVPRFGARGRFLDA